MTESTGVTYQQQQRELIATIRQNMGSMAQRATTVPMQSDYAQDPARCLTLISFVPAAATRTIQRTLQTQLEAVAPEHYFYPAESMHITIKNIRSAATPPGFSAHDIARADQLLGTILTGRPAIHFKFQELVAFPNSISLIGYSSAALQALVLDLDRTLRAAGLPDDKRYMSDTVFFGNITFCRFTTDPTPAFLDAARSLTLAAPVQVEVNELTLITCNAAAAPSTITRHAAVALGGRPARGETAP